MKIALITRACDAYTTFKTEGNLGNLVFRTAIYNMIPHAFKFDWHEYNRMAECDADAFVVPLANCVSSAFKFSEELLEGWEKSLRGRPLIGIGIGADAPFVDSQISLDPNTVSWLELFSALWTRGPYTSAILARYGIDSTSGCCPSLFSTSNCPNYNNLSFHMGDIGVSPAPPSRAGKKINELLFSNASGHIFIQGPVTFLDYWKKGQITKIIRELGLRDTDRDRLYLSFEFNKWVEALKEHKVIFSGRFHCAALAFNNSIPTVMLPLDLRTHELCETFNMPTFDYKTSEVITIPEFDEQKFRENRFWKRIAFDKFLAYNGL